LLTATHNRLAPSLSWNLRGNTEVTATTRK